MKNKKDSENTVQYLPICMAIGVAIGVAIGAAVHNIPMFMSFGVSIGVGVGALIDARLKKDSDTSDDEEEK